MVDPKYGRVLVNLTNIINRLTQTPMRHQSTPNMQGVAGHDMFHHDRLLFLVWTRRLIFDFFDEVLRKLLDIEAIAIHDCASYIVVDGFAILGFPNLTMYSPYAAMKQGTIQ